ncbi:MAG: hypothetical protein IPJ41_09295 [Phycisphaerales bacterium]|nr:hypothetical protein [Phycisphaerales bacterium]
MNSPRVSRRSTPGADSRRANYEGVFGNGLGLSFGERFGGQGVSDGTNQNGNGVHDVVSGSPTGPLTLAAGEATRNLSMGDTTLFGGSGHAIGGLSSVGWPNFQAIGEGAMAVLFEFDQPDLGFTVFGDTGPGDLKLDFFGRDGALLGSITLDEVTDGAYGFRTSDGSASIAGMLLTNNEDEGLAYDNFKYHQLPAPGGAGLLIATGLLAVRRRR